MMTNAGQIIIREEDTLREVLLAYPQALRVILRWGIPVTCAAGTVADAARACDLPVDLLVAELRECASDGMLGVDWHEGTRRSRSNRYTGRFGR